jgi:hypothetical protein
MNCKLGWWLCGLLAVLPACTSSSTPPSDESVPLEHMRQMKDKVPGTLTSKVIWDREKRDQPKFIPADLLIEQGIHSVAPDSTAIENLEKEIEAGKRRGVLTDWRQCKWNPPNGLGLYPDPSRPLDRLLAERGFVGRARVISLVPGWSHDRVQTMVYVEVLEPLHCFTGSPPIKRSIKPGDILATLFQVGALTVEGVELCTANHLDLLDLSVGDEVVVGGFIPESDSIYMGNQAVILKLEDDQVESLGGQQFWPNETVRSVTESLKNFSMSCNRSEQ